MRPGARRLLLAGVRNPRLALRYINGKSPSEISLDEIAQYVTSKCPVIVEAGAYDGQDTLRFASYWPNGTVHSFEPVPDLMRRVRKTTSSHPNIHLYEMALVGDPSAGHVYLHVANGTPNASGSILEPTEHLSVFPDVDLSGGTSVPAVTLSKWADEHDVRHVDLLWLDVQGAELAILNAGKSLLQETRVVHLEVSRRPLYKDSATWPQVRAFMEAEGFKQVLARVPVVTGNALFVRQTRKGGCPGSRRT